MTLIPLSSKKIFTNKNINLIATDMDGTLTRYGKFSASLFKALEALAVANISVLIVTGRSAGWVQGLKSYLPVTGAIAENGGVFFLGNSEEPKLLTPIADLITHRQNLATTFAYLKSHFPKIKESTDNPFRLTDWTFDVQGLTIAELHQLEQLCQAKNWGFTYSTVQCHIKPEKQTKATSLLQVLNSYFPQLTTENLITVGDSPNDETLFDQSIFPVSVGVANVLHYQDKLKFLPTYVTSLAEGEGFRELAELVLQMRSH
ncbi:HAD family hydrolase [[Phormidium ambiguum] IAM M-71]|uniref:HAD family hydrolase n=1 Tax=[Phormidium ambiguum] IAM M-71 TaxID=454136 RepID=A0A1U7ISM9_9CYAN|nr:HAD-IIB family hydrolase [Phormidium ambiguum]OKH40517.1 HAD family hydrolase [Phormidium ambiguum IAM M-71]